MNKDQVKGLLRSIFIGKRYFELKSIGDQVRYLTMNYIFMVAMVPLIILGVTVFHENLVRAVIDFTIAGLCLASIVLARSKVPLNFIPLVPVTIFGAYCLFLLYGGDLNLWAAAWLFSFPPIVIFLCQMTAGIIESIIVLIGTIVIMYSPLAASLPDNDIRMRILGVYVLILSLTIIYERVSILKDRKEAALKAELANERDMIQTMKDNIHQGIFLMDKELRILPQYSRPLVAIFSYYESELAGKNFLDILSASLDAKQLQLMKGYFSMIFGKTKNPKVLESANPISEFEYKVDNRSKILSTRFNLIEQANSEPVIIGIIQDITREKEFEREIQAQKESQEMEMKNLFDVLQVDPLVFQDFIEDAESNFNYINAVLKDRTLTERQVVTKLFQNIHATKSNALILGLESFGNKLHTLEDVIKAVLDKSEITVDDVFSLTINIETIMQELDDYIEITKKINAYKTANQMDTVLISSMTRAVEKIAGDAHKKVELKAGQIDLDILETKLRKPIKDILYQCVRNSIYHGIEPVDERIRKQKKPQGLLAFNIKKIGGTAEVTFSDDGAGLNWEKIEKKYLEKHPGAKADRKLLLASIFTPEFSTADKTSLLAGRGVGLSLVKDLVKENRGSINVNSSDAGLIFKFTFPLV
ncbi:MAG: ATP-binding protein [Treponema sp.]|nr:ATP-binding protein [Treponema sp.]